MTRWSDLSVSELRALQRQGIATEKVEAELLARGEEKPKRRKRKPLGPEPYPEFVAMLEGLGLPAPVREYRFARPRRWRFDYAWPGSRVAVEVEGGVFSGGRHTRGAGFRADVEKYSEAASLGWLVIRALPEQLVTVEMRRWLENAHSNASRT